MTACPKCGSTDVWCECCPACGSKHHLRDCPKPIMGAVNMRPLLDLMKEATQRTKEIDNDHAHSVIELELVKPLNFPSIKIFDLEDTMEKRGVVIDDEKTKTASKEKLCPKCGAKLNEPDKCDTCGTEPFEKR